MAKRADSCKSGSTSPKRGSVTPSEFMRTLRPEYYSDSTERTDYDLDRPALEYQLSTVTSRNETNDFEIFCRKLCERSICLNLRVQTGPEGGGDSKADSETYPVADEIAALTYVGTPNAGSERWAFAFSAKAKWKEKIRSDVQKLAQTNRGYTRIICLTSQFARSKARAALEDELTERYGIQVTIHDRSWIVSEILDKDRKDLAFNYLHVGTERKSTFPLCNNDYSRSQQLEEIEKSLADPAAFDGIETQRVSEALIAAKLSRGLERPRTETEGRFTRAIRLAEREGTHRQILQAHYETIWTAFWWYDDAAFLNASYDQFESLLQDDDHITNVDFLANLSLILSNSVVFGFLTLENSKLTERVARLRSRLTALAGDKEKPNSALEAETKLLLLELNEAVRCEDRGRIASIWPRFANVLTRAGPMGEFDAPRLVELIDIAGNVAQKDPAYGDLVEQLADFISRRRSEGEGARILLRRAQQLDFDQNFEMIRLLGKAARQLTKKEYADDLIDAQSLLALSYRSAGLLWAARAACLMAASTITIESEPDSQVSPRLLPVIELFAWISLQLRHLPDFLLAMRLLSASLVSLPLDDESKARLADKFQTLDGAFASNILNFSDSEVREIETLPAVLESIGMAISRAALLFSLGYEDLLQHEGWISEKETPEDMARLFSHLASQPVSKDMRGPLILNKLSGQEFQTCVLGFTLTVSTTGTNCALLVAEAFLGSIEALLATADEYRVFPHVESFSVKIVEQAQLAKPDFVIEADNMLAVLNWPQGRMPADFDFQEESMQGLFLATGQVLATVCCIPDTKEMVRRLFADDRVTERISMASIAANSYSRIFGRRLSRLGEGKKAYPLRNRPTLTVKRVTIDDEESDPDPKVTSHRTMEVRSVIDTRLWDRATWRGIAVLDYGRQLPPVLGLIFETREAAEKIFSRWRERFTAEDTQEAIHLAIIRQVSTEEPAHYKVLITSNMDALDKSNDRRFTVASRFTTMTPNDTRNLDHFLSRYAEVGAYLLAPVVLSDGNPEPLDKLYLLKRRLIVRDAKDIKPHDLEAMALRPQAALDGPIG